MTAHDTSTSLDPKVDAGADKIPLSALPWAVVAEAAVGMGEGALKYGDHNWRTSGDVRTMSYIDAAQRHLVAYTLGEDLDPESGLCHISKAISSLMVLRDAQIHGVDVDNRPPASWPGMMSRINGMWSDVRGR